MENEKGIIQKIDEVVVKILFSFLTYWQTITIRASCLSFYNQTLQFLKQIHVKNGHPVYGAGIQTHNLLNATLLPYPLGQGFRFPNYEKLF